jgi:uncharacterized radical SAM superfamily protein
MKYYKEEAIHIANEFIAEVNKLEKRYNMKFNSDTGDIYLSYERKEQGKYWDTISLGFDGDGSSIKVIEDIKIKEKLKKQALSKLTDDEREVLGL